MHESAFLESAQTWADSAIDDHDALMTKALIEKSKAGDKAAQAKLDSMFAGPLRFGTAGLRAPMGPGQTRMNSSVIAQASWGFANWLKEHQGKSIVIGFDARKNSEKFARIAAEVFSAMGLHVYLANEATPTPVLAFGVTHLDADAGVMITASHNPRDDNGYKVYLGDGRQIAPPVDTEISARIETAPMANSVPREVALITDWPTDLIEAYIMTAANVPNYSDSTLPNSLESKWVYTPMHGVGYQTLSAVLAAAHLPLPIVVKSQVVPDGRFPTLAFPNPEEAGALDLAIATGRDCRAELIIANDPDADRCAVAIETPAGWSQLTGDQIGALLAWWRAGLCAAKASDKPNQTFATTLVSSSLISEIAKKHNYRFEATLTGFKWISRVEGLVFGYEEAFGYCVDPTHVKDKDGITAAVVILWLHLLAKSEGKTLLDLLDDLYLDYGLYFTETRSTRVQSSRAATKIVTALALSPPVNIGEFQVSRFVDLARGVEGLPPTAGVRFWLSKNVRVIIRPSGTEPKVKVYLQITTATAQDTLIADKARALALAEQIHQALAKSVLRPTP